MIFDLIAICPDETKDILVEELKSIGAVAVEPGYKAVYFKASEEIFYLVHLKIRSASRILRVIKNVPANSLNMLFDQAQRIRWSEIFDETKTFIVEGIVADRGSQAPKSNDVSKRVKEGMYASFDKAGKSHPKVDLKEPEVVVIAFLHKGRCTISVDTSGKSLHKRGYRMEGHPAPLKETLAASLLLLAGYNGSEPLWDPMCGSGTVAIEGAMIALHKASQIHRKKGDFGFENLAMFNKDLWKTLQDDVRLERLADPPCPIIATDINSKFIELARENALRARVEKHIVFKDIAIQNITQPIIRELVGSSKPGIVIANLPYGERIKKDDEDALIELYKDIGNTLKRHFIGWKAVLLTSENAPYKFIGLRPKRKISLLNGSIQVKLLFFDLYEGKKVVPPTP